MFWQPLWAQADGIVVSAPGTTLGQAGNGVPIVNIAAPNGSGLSHNQFHDYNVGANGVILNNAIDRTQSTQLGGIILGNSNLNGRAATTILNEVNGGSPSQLRGYTEVAGQSAHVIVANPYGISCSGCGFINTPQATLTTGKPVITNGQVSGYQVDQGSVSIEGAGLNANNIDQFEIITRSARLNAEIQAKNLAIIAGANDVDAKTLKATARTANPANAPQLAIDSSALGGMYAGAIKLVGTEAGVGVKLDGKMVASGGDIQLDANGHLSMVDTAATGAVNLKAQSLEAKGPVYAGTTLDMQTQGDLTSQNNLVAKDRITLNSGGQLSNNGIIEAGVNLDNTRNSEGDVSVTAQNLTNAGKTIIASRDLSITTTQTLNNQGGTLSGQRQTTVTAGTLDNQNKGRVLSADRLNLTADKALNGQGGLINSVGQLSATLGHLNNNGAEVSSKGDATLILGTMDNLTGVVMAENTLGITASDTLNNQNGLLSGWQGLTLNGTTLDNRNSGTVSSRNGDVGVTLSGALLNSHAGAVVSQKSLTVRADSLDNSDKGVLSSAAGQRLTVTGLLDNTLDGSISSGAALTLQAMALNNGGTVNATDALTFTGTNLDNSNGTFTGNAGVTLDLLGTLTNSNGKLSSVGPLLVQRSAQINNQNGGINSQGLLTLLTGGLDNSHQGTIGANDTLLVTASGAVDNSGDGLIASRNADLQLTAASLGNAKGSLQGKGAVSLTVAGDIDNQSGKVIAQDGDLSVSAANLDSRGGTLSSVKGALKTQVVGVLKNGYDLNNSQGGTLQAQRLMLNALGGIDNKGGRIAAQAGDAVLNAGTLGTIDNRNGGVYASNRVQVSGNNLDNSGDLGGKISGNEISFSLLGKLNNRKGIIESGSTLSTTAASLDNQNGQLRSLGRSLKTLFAIGGLLDNSNGILETANTDLGLDIGSFQNQGGSVLHVGAGIFGLSMANLEDVGGRLVTHGDLTLDGDSWTNSSSIQANHLTVTVNHLTQTATGQLLSTTGLKGTGIDWSNDGLFGTDGALDVNLSGHYQGKGRLSSLGTLDFHAAQLDLDSSASVAGGGNTTINIDGILNNSGRLTAAADLSVTAGSLNNLGTLGSTQKLTATTGALLNDHGLIFSGGDMSLRVDSLTNSYANVYSLGNLSIDRDGQGGLASSIVNSSGSLESDMGMSLAASTIRNVRAVLTTDDPGIYTASIVEVQCIEGYNAGDCSGKQNHVWQIVQRDKFEVTEASAASSITAGGNLSLQGGDLVNQSSTIAAGGALSATVVNLTNSGLETGETETSRTFRSERTNNASGLYNAAAAFNNSYSVGGAGYNANNLGGLQGAMSAFIGMTEAELGQFFSSRKIDAGDQSYAAVIQAGGAVSVNAQTGISSSVVRPGYTYVGAGPRTDTQAPANTFSTRITVNQQLPPDLAQQQVNPLSLPGFSLPVGENGLFRLSGQASAVNQPSAHVPGLPDNSGRSSPQKYLIETNPVLTDLKQFMSSDYLLSNLGYDPQASAKRLGDGFYEQKLIQQAVTARTGQRFIDGQTSDDGMFKYLMNNAVASKQQLDLQLGVSLTSEQVAALTHDIVWMENQTVNGEQVLVPVLYLANANNRLAANGALIQGDDVTLIAGKELNNAGTLRASNNLSATSANDMVNSGLLEANNRLDALAGNNLTNKAGGIIAGRDVSVTATTGDVTNERTLTTHESSTGYKTEQRGFADSTARIEAGNNLTVTAGRDIANSGGALKSTQDTVLKAGRDVNITSAEQVNSNTLGDHHNDRTITQNGSSISSGRDLVISAGRDLAAVASQIEAKRDVALSAVGDLTLSSAADEQHSYGRTKKVTSQEDHVQQVATNVSAGGNVVLTAGNDLDVIASRVKSANEAYLYAGHDLTLETVANSDYSYYSKTKKGSWGKKSSTMTESGSEQAVSSVIETQGKTTIAAVNDVNITGSTVNSEKGALVVRAGNDVNLSAAQNSQFNASAKSKSGGFGLSSTSKKSSDASSSTSLIGATLSADTTLVQAGHDLVVSASNVVSTEQTDLQARNDIRIESDTESFSAQHSQSTKKSGLMSSGGIGVTLGSSKNTYTQDTETRTEKASTVGSVLGSVNITAGKDLSIKSSDIVADKDINLAGQNVHITDAANTNSTRTAQSSSKSGLTLALSGVVGEAVNTAVQTAQAAKQEDDSRLAALQGIKAGLSGYQAWQGAQALESGAQTGSFVGIALSLGTQKSSSKQLQEQSVSQGSSLTAGKDLTIIAVGDGQPGSTAGDISVVGSKLQAGHDVSMTAARDIELSAGSNTQKQEGSNKSGGGAVGISLGVGSSGAGLSIFASGNSGVGKEKGNGTAWTETTVNAGNQLSLKSGRDTTLEGAQATAQKVVADIGRNLTLTSLQDSDRFDSKQTNVSGGASFTFGSMTGSASLSISQDKIKSNFGSVQEQTGLFAGKDGYQVSVGEHTQLNGAVIASTSSADQNKLSTGTLGWTDIGNKADFSSQHQGISGGTGGDTGSMFMGNMGSMLLAGANHSGHESSTTYSAVSVGEINIRDKDKQQQDVATLSRDVEHANNALSPIFDKEKEQKRLRQAQLIGEIGNQALDIIRTQGAIETANALKDPQKIETARQQLADKGNTEPTNEQIANQITNVVMRDYGTGGNYQRAAQAVTAAIQGLAGGNIAQALVGASAPYLAGVIKESTGDNLEARIMAHAVLGAVLAKSQGGSALAGAAGASIGELIATQLYPGKKASELSEVEKQKISALSTLAGGLVGGLIGGDSASAIVAGSTAKNAVENNEISFPLSDSFGAAAASLDNYLVQQGATPEERSDAQRSLARGDGYRGPGHDFVEGWAYASGAAGAALVLPELAMGCGLSPALCNEVGIIAAEMAGGDAALGGTALGIFGGGAGVVLKDGVKGGKVITEISEEMKKNPYHPDWQFYSSETPRNLSSSFNSSATPDGKPLTDHAFESLIRHGFKNLQQVDDIVNNATHTITQLDGATVFVQKLAPAVSRDIILLLRVKTESLLVCVTLQSRKSPGWRITKVGRHCLFK
ncbi:hemagglutinin repeat-containing protein [Pseudomonas gingeri]|nr:hemagglutinin repeat-containing protein [Pseudomonas gingeri]